MGQDTGNNAPLGGEEGVVNADVGTDLTNLKVVITYSRTVKWVTMTIQEAEATKNAIERCIEILRKHANTLLKN